MENNSSKEKDNSKPEVQTPKDISPKDISPKDPNPILHDEFLVRMNFHNVVEQIKENNQTDLKNLAYEYSKSWSKITSYVVSVLCIVFFSLLSFFIAPKWIENKIEELTVEQKVKELVTKFTKVELKPVRTDIGTLSNQTETLSSNVIRQEEKINSLNKDAGSLTSYIDTLKKDSELLQKQLNIQQLIVTSKTDMYSGKDCYKKLRNLASHPDYEDEKLKNIIHTAIREIEFYFDVFKFQTSGPSLTADALLSLEEIIYAYRFSDIKDDVRESAIFSLIEIHTKTPIEKNVVQELCESIESEQNLRVIARTTNLLEELTGEKFRPLEFDFVHNWWEANKEKEIYKSPFKDYLKAINDYNDYINQKNLTIKKIKEIILLLEKTKNEFPKALHARCFLAEMNIVLFETYQEQGNPTEANKVLDKAIKELDEVETLDNNFRWLFYSRTHLYVVRDEENDSITAKDSFNKLKEISPGLADKFKNQPIIKNKNLEWLK